MTADKVDDPIGVVEAIFQLLPKKKFEDLYGITLEESDTTEELIQKVGIAYGRLRFGGKGEINEEEVAKLIIRDWQNNKLKYFLSPPGWSDDTNISDARSSAEENELLTHAGLKHRWMKLDPQKNMRVDLTVQEKKVHIAQDVKIRTFSLFQFPLFLEFLWLLFF